MEFKRTWEKVLAWIGNVVMILVTIVFSLVTFSGSITQSLNNPTVKQQIELALTEEGYSLYTYDQVVSVINVAARFYTILVIVALVLALIATFVMKSRITSGIIFLLLAIVIAIFSFGTLVIVYIPYFIVAILLFVRKPQNNYPTYNNNSNNEQIDRVEYM